MSFEVNIRKVVPYVAGEQPQGDVIKLNTNESPYPPSKKVIKALSEVEKEMASNGVFKSSFTGQEIENLLKEIYFYLNAFDRFVSEQAGIFYGRYVDDMVVIHQSKVFLLKLKIKIQKYFYIISILPRNHLLALVCQNRIPEPF